MSEASSNGRRSRQAGADRDNETRRRVIDAAIRCILEQGFYRASSNAIAERAGLSWGVIQYYFGSRELLMLAVLQEGTRRLTDDLATAEITGETLPERVESYLTIIESYYADPEYLAFVQVLLNLGHDPRTSSQTLETMSRITRTVEIELERLTKSLLAGNGSHERKLRGLLFHALRGLALSEVMLGALPFDTHRRASDLPDQRRLLAQALSLLIESETGAGGSPAVVSRRARSG